MRRPDPDLELAAEERGRVVRRYLKAAAAVFAAIAVALGAWMAIR